MVKVNMNLHNFKLNEVAQSVWIRLQQSKTQGYVLWSRMTLYNCVTLQLQYKEENQSETLDLKLSR